MIKICDTCDNSEIIKHDNGMVTMHCHVHNRGTGTCQTCKNWEVEKGQYIKYQNKAV